ncbi:MAG: B12-binding domain-containing radical SAM protein [Rhodobacteraceae bacterium]|nr:B12-binding domain-containing radical SAM protein [Paracoccaceae bacterium]
MSVNKKSTPNQDHSDQLPPTALQRQWRALRKSVATKNPHLWSILRANRHFLHEIRQDLSNQGIGQVLGSFGNFVPNAAELLPKKRSPYIWVDLGEFGELTSFDSEACFQDHGVGLLRTIMHKEGLISDLVSLRTTNSWDTIRKQLKNRKILILNVRSYHVEPAREAARIFKELNPDGVVVTGGMHATVSPTEMQEIKEFDKICIGPGENVIVDLVSNPDSFPRVFPGKGAASMADWPWIDRTLWPKPVGLLKYKMNWPLEPGLRWGPRPVATVLTSRVCPWQCSFCNEMSYIKNMGRRPVDDVIDELNDLDDKWGVGSVVIHDSMFFQKPNWLKEWLEKYPKRANKTWPYWAAARSDTVREWPELFERLVRETNWNSVSIGFEAGSDRALRILNKQVTEEDNAFTIDLVNRIGDDMEREGLKPVSFWSNIMLGIPGERPEDAFKTIRMIKRMKRARLSAAYYAAYPGAALGHQIIAEGKNLKPGEHQRGDGQRIKGVDYDFYDDLLNGKYDQQVNEGLDLETRSRVVDFGETAVYS